MDFAWCESRSPGNTRGVSQSSRELGRDQALVALCLEEVAGAALVVDRELRVVLSTPRAEAMVGVKLTPGERAVQLLCGESPTRPVADALARGIPVSAEVVRPTASGERIVHIRTVPLRVQAKVVGQLLLLSDAGPAQAEVTERFGILTASENMRQLLRDVEKVAKSESSVLIRGETGAGKELVARALHELSPRSSGPFRAINCAALPEHLLESELFGHVRGAFTGAVRDAEGHFRLASGGTLFLDEVAELPLQLQAKLLRVLQEKTVLPVGGREPIPVDVRLVSATHRSLREQVAAGRFRSDLMYRLRVIPLFLPPLRERPRDIELLAQHFVAQHNRASSVRQVARISPGALRVLLDWDFPGNVRELQNAIEYAFVLGDGPVLTEAELPRDLREGVGGAHALAESGSPAGARELNSPPEPAPAETLPAEARRLLRALERAGGSRERAAQTLGVSRTTLWRKLKQYGIDER